MQTPDMKEWEEDLKGTAAGEEQYRHLVRFIRSLLHQSQTELMQKVILPVKLPDDGNGDDDAYNGGWNAYRSAIITYAKEQGIPLND